MGPVDMTTGPLSIRRVSGTVRHGVPASRMARGLIDGGAMTLLTGRVPMPRFVWIAVVLEVATAVLAIPVGLIFITDPTGKGMGIDGWLAGTIFPDYLVPGLCLFAVNGLGMVVLAMLTIMRRPIAPWLTGALGVGLMIWIGVQVAIMPRTMFLQPTFFAVGLVLGFVALFWLLAIRRMRALQAA